MRKFFSEAIWNSLQQLEELTRVLRAYILGLRSISGLLGRICFDGAVLCCSCLMTINAARKASPRGKGRRTAGPVSVS